MKWRYLINGWAWLQRAWVHLLFGWRNSFLEITVWLPSLPSPSLNLPLLSLLLYFLKGTLLLQAQKRIFCMYQVRVSGGNWIQLKWFEWRIEWKKALGECERLGNKDDWLHQGQWQEATANHRAKGRCDLSRVRARTMGEGPTWQDRLVFFTSSPELFWVFGSPSSCSTHFRVSRCKLALVVHLLPIKPLDKNANGQVFKNEILEAMDNLV